MLMYIRAKNGSRQFLQSVSSEVRTETLSLETAEVPAFGFTYGVVKPASGFI
jgi:hypothetical protein